MRLQLPESLQESAAASDELYALAHAVKEPRPAPADPAPAQRSAKNSRIDTRPRLAVLPQDDEGSGR